MSFLRKFSEGLARKTSRRGFFGRGADVAFGTLIGAAAGTALGAKPASAGGRSLSSSPRVGKRTPSLTFRIDNFASSYR